MRDWTASCSLPHELPSELPSEYPFKRPLDLLLASAALIITFPLWCIIGIAIKIEDGGPTFYIQKRWGKDKKPINVYKFRTMVVDADEKFGPVQAQEHDPRITRVGQFLRAMGFDEMPQLLNILKGEMSCVGPRALPMNEVQLKGDEGSLPDDAILGFDRRCRVRPGLTGVAQVYAPRDISRQEKFSYDLLYIREQSIRLDLKLLALSLWITFRGRWESREKKF